MISDEQEFEAALEEATGLFQRPGELNREDEVRLRALLDAIKAYQPGIRLRPDDPLRGRLNALTDHLDAFQKRWEKDHPTAGAHWLSTGGYIFPG
jgi:antitoxin component HigA of HigAB toxin-antitoxin module